MIGIIDYGRGNLLSVKNAVEMITEDVKLCTAPSDLEDVSKIILPGVGAFRDAMAQLHDQGWVEPLKRAVENKKRPLLGICLGMQILAELGHEPVSTEGLGWIRGEVCHILRNDPSLKIPHVGWNTLQYRKDCFLFHGLPEELDLYFVHSYSMQCKDSGDVVATVDYGVSLVAAVQKGNILGVQFHPEKSQGHGLKILENFIRWKGESAC